jgi:Mn-containing catalase
MFMLALESVGKLTEPAFGNIKPDETVNVYYHLSANGAPQRGPWNQEPQFNFIAHPEKLIEHGEPVGAQGPGNKLCNAALSPATESSRGMKQPLSNQAFPHRPSSGPTEQK